MNVSETKVADESIIAFRSRRVLGIAMLGLSVAELIKIGIRRESIGTLKGYSMSLSPGYDVQLTYLRNFLSANSASYKEVEELRRSLGYTKRLPTKKDKVEINTISDVAQQAFSIQKDILSSMEAYQDGKITLEEYCNKVFGAISDIQKTVKYISVRILTEKMGHTLMDQDRIIIELKEEKQKKTA